MATCLPYENCKEDHGLLLAGSLGELKGKVFRVGHMGPGATKEAIETLLSALDAVPEDIK